MINRLLLISVWNGFPLLLRLHDEYYVNTLSFNPARQTRIPLRGQAFMRKATKKQAKRHYSRKRIIDEFTDLNLSRRRKYQLRRVRAELCVKCKNPLVPGHELCVQHIMKVALLHRNKLNSSHPHRGKWLDLAEKMKIK